MNKENIQTIVSLTLARLEIIKLRSDGYNWSFVATSDKELLENCLKEIDSLIQEVKSL